MHTSSAPASSASAGDVKYSLRLFVVGRTRLSQTAVENLKQVCASLGNCTFGIIDIVDFPEVAEHEHLVATPTLIRDLPLPKRKIIGDLADMKTVLFLLRV